MSRPRRPRAPEPFRHGPATSATRVALIARTCAVTRPRTARGQPSCHCCRRLHRPPEALPRRPSARPHSRAHVWLARRACSNRHRPTCLPKHVASSDMPVLGGRAARAVPADEWAKLPLPGCAFAPSPDVLARAALAALNRPLPTRLSQVSPDGPNRSSNARAERVRPDGPEPILPNVSAWTGPSRSRRTCRLNGPSRTCPPGRVQAALARTGPSRPCRRCPPGRAQAAFAGRAGRNRSGRTCPPARARAGLAEHAGPRCPCRRCPRTGPGRSCRCPPGRAQAALAERAGRTPPAERVRPDGPRLLLPDAPAEHRSGRTCPPARARAGLAEHAGPRCPRRRCPRMGPRPLLPMSARAGPGCSCRTCRPKPPCQTCPPGRAQAALAGRACRPKPPSPKMSPRTGPRLLLPTARAKRVRPEGPRPLLPNAPAKSARAKRVRPDGPKPLSTTVSTRAGRASLAGRVHPDGAKSLRTGPNRPTRTSALARRVRADDPRPVCPPRPPSPDASVRAAPVAFNASVQAAFAHCVCPARPRRVHRLSVQGDAHRFCLSLNARALGQANASDRAQIC